jgi:ribulose-5-phosphate 4-epimerase/fuculose-1-phosphate aldolase
MKDKMTSINELKKKLVEAAAICEMEGLSDAFGHVTVRVPGTNEILMTPQGAPGRAKVSEIVTLDLNGKKIRGRGKPNSEFPIHTSIYRVRKDVQSVVHVHPPKVVAFSIAGKELLPMRISDRKFVPSVPIFGDPGTDVYIDTDKLGDKMAQALGKGFALIIRGHGAVTVGESIEDACLNAVHLEKIAEAQFMASMLLLSQSTQKDFQCAAFYVLHHENVVDGGPRILKREYDFYVSKVNRYLNKK